VISRMVHTRPEDDLNEQLTLHALGLLEGDEAAEVEDHLAQCAVCEAEMRELRETAASVALAASAVEPPAHLRSKILDRATPQVWKQWDSVAMAHMHVVRDGQGEWQRVREGVYAKQLYVDRARDSATMLIRMEPGSKYVPHRHGGPEQCFVLQGDIREGDHVFRAGDFQCLAEGSVHDAQWTEEGCLLLIVSSLEDELLV
jgi:anti-sigma factor ChrR (cupin superfamily)